MLNVELLRKVQAQILKEPRQFLMELFFYSGPRYRDLGPEEVIPNCGTAACIAGWAIAIDRQMTPKEAHEATRYEEGDDTRRGAEALRISRKQAETLFFTEYWPGEFRDRYEDDQRPEARAKVAADYIDYFIKVNS